MRNIGETLLIACAVLAGAVAGVSYFFDGLPSWKVALVFVGFVLVTIGSVALSLRFFAATLNTRTTRYEQPIEGDYRALDDYRPPQMQLPARTINVPRYSNMGSAQPWGKAPAQKIDLQTTTDTGSVMTVSLDKLQDFLDLPTPKRSEWAGDKNAYSQCLAFCVCQGLLTKRGNGFEWASSYPTIARREWIEQFESQR